MPKEHSIRVEANFEFFEEQVAELKDDLVALCKGLAKLVIVDISLNRDQDNPQLIFESLNSTGRELSQADLIRNFILMGLEPQLQTQALRAVLAADGGGLRAGGLWHALRRLHAPLPDGEDRRDPQRPRGLRGVQAATRARPSREAGVEALVADIRAFAGYYCAMALGAETDPDLRRRSTTSAS